MKDFKISFFKKGAEEDKFLGSVVIDDGGTGTHLTLQAKGFRQAGEAMLNADRVVVEEI